MAAPHPRDVQEFEIHRHRLVGLAYRMLGSRTDADDVVQDAFLRWHGADRRGIGDPGRWLGTVVTRLCLDRIKSARARRELYVGAWLPEPVVDECFDTEPGSDAHDISIALMLTLERLSPLERAAFLLHDVFELDFAEIARALDRTEPAVRQLASRARDHLRRERPRFPASVETGRKLAAAFRTAAESGDAHALLPLLAEDAVLVTDGGGRKLAAFNPILGADKILRFFQGVARKSATEDGAAAVVAFRAATVNGMAGLVLKDPDGAVATIAFEPRDGRIGAIYLVRNPDKLRHVRF
jgi:RNA polymerase sigma-70 factor (ECF subfamily)